MKDLVVIPNLFYYFSPIKKKKHRGKTKRGEQAPLQLPLPCPALPPNPPIPVPLGTSHAPETTTRLKLVSPQVCRLKMYLYLFFKSSSFSLHCPKHSTQNQEKWTEIPAFSLITTPLFPGLNDPWARGAKILFLESLRYSTLRYYFKSEAKGNFSIKNNSNICFL